jgi:hypothetical protein
MESMGTMKTGHGLIWDKNTNAWYIPEENSYDSDEFYTDSDGEIRFHPKENLKKEVSFKDEDSDNEDYDDYLEWYNEEYKLNEFQIMREISHTEEYMIWKNSKRRKSARK